MGRLFWKFFFCIGLAQLTAIVGVGIVFWVEHQQRAQHWQQAGPDGPHRPPAAPSATGSPASLAQSAALSATGMQTPLAPQLTPVVMSVPPSPSSPGLLRPPPPGGPPLDGPPPRGPFPVVPLVAALLASLVFAVLLARYVARPIRNLRTAFDRAAAGQLDARPAAQMGGRRDELADLGQDFERMAEQLRGVLDGQRRLLHDVSHELRSPLARLQAAIGLARQQPARMADSMTRIERECGRMDRLIEELLTLSRLDAAAPVFCDEVVLADLVEGIVADARFEAAGRSVGIDWLADGDAVVAADGRLLHRAIENVLRNAVKFSPPGQSVRVRMTGIPEERRVEVAISDGGPGVPADELPSIFTPFFRGSGVRHVDGHGLGLTITRRVVEACGGSVCASNLPAGGLQVVIALPTATE